MHRTVVKTTSSLGHFSQNVFISGRVTCECGSRLLLAERLSLRAVRTPYDAVRGDIRDHPTPANCEAVSLWSIYRHGNRNPSDGVIEGMRKVSQLKDEIIASYDAGRSQLCEQDIDQFRKWSWNETLESSVYYLTGAGYEELYDLGKRLREAFPHLLQGTEEDYYFRATKLQRTINSGVAFVRGLTDGVAALSNVAIDNVRERDDVIRPYIDCDRYQKEVTGGQVLADQLEAYYKTPEYLAMQNAVQERLGISTLLSADQVYSMYEICRVYRTWTQTLKDPWCALFTDDDLQLLEYYDDVRHYYRNGYGSWINLNLGKLPLKDFYENFHAAVQGQGKRIVSYFSHDTMLEMMMGAMGLYQDDFTLDSTYINPNRLWRSSFISAFGANILGVLNRCNESESESYRVQIFVNEKETSICRLDGCTWEEFQQKFQNFSSANLDICPMDEARDL